MKTVPIFEDDTPLTLSEIEKRAVEAALRHYGGTVTKCAEHLGKDRWTMNKIIQRHGLEHLKRKRGEPPRKF